MPKTFRLIKSAIESRDCKHENYAKNLLFIAFRRFRVNKLSSPIEFVSSKEREAREERQLKLDYHNKTFNCSSVRADLLSN